MWQSCRNGRARPNDELSDCAKGANAPTGLEVSKLASKEVQEILRARHAIVREPPISTTRLKCRGNVIGVERN